jgi:hypothetical protein
VKTAVRAGSKKNWAWQQTTRQAAIASKAKQSLVTMIPTARVNSGHEIASLRCQESSVLLDSSHVHASLTGMHPAHFEARSREEGRMEEKELWTWINRINRIGQE